MKVALCCICKNENDYIKEFVEYYKNIGFDNIIVYDNNDVNGEQIEDVINDYVTSGFVIINNIRGKSLQQLPAYNDCIKKYSDDYDWIAFFDVDEYLCFTEHNNIKDYLSTFPDTCDRVAVHWMVMDDNDMLENDGRPLMERFTRPIDRFAFFEYATNTKNYENSHVKTILRTKHNDNRKFVNPHYLSGCIQSMDNRGKKIASNTPFISDINWDKAYLKHFRLKTITEYLYNKVLKGAPDLDFYRYIHTRCRPDKFFKINKRTPEKMKIVKKFIDDHSEMYNKK